MPRIGWRTRRNILTFYKRAQRSRQAFEARQAAYTEIWEEFEALTGEMRSTGDGLRRVLGSHEAERFIAEANGSSMVSIDAMEQAARWAKERVEDFWQACQASEPVTSAGTGSPSVPCGPRSAHVPHAAERLHRYLKKNATNRSKFAKRLTGKVSLKTISKLLNTGVATPSTLDEIASAMKISKEEMVRPE